MQQQAVVYTPIRKSNVRYLTPAHLKERQSTPKLCPKEADAECEKLLLLLGWTLPALTEEYVHHLLRFISCVRDQMVGVARLAEIVDSGKTSFIVILRMVGSMDHYRSSVSTFNGAAARMVGDQKLLKDPSRVTKVLDLDFGTADTDCNLVSILLYQMASICTHRSGEDTETAYKKFLRAELERVNNEEESMRSKLELAAKEAIKWEEARQNAIICNNTAGMPASLYESMYEQKMSSLADARLLEIQERENYSKAIKDIADMSTM
jgi:hypothetical protein